jgi:holliday junction DNA helicase RuvA
MIASLRGTLAEKHPNRVTVDVSGVGYDVTIPVSTFSALSDAGTTAALLIHTHVREDAIALFGFATSAEKGLFEKLISVSGIGPTLAIKVLSGLAATELIRAIRGGLVDHLVRIPGVGKKTAERMVLELRDKMTQLVVPAAAEAAPVSPADRLRTDLLSALHNLGYHRPHAEKAVDAALAAPDAAAGGATFEQALKAALRELMR